MTTPILGITELTSNQSQPEVTVNEAFRSVEALTVRALSATTTAEPTSPAEGDAYIIPAGATGTNWATFSQNDVAWYMGGVWYNKAPLEGLRLWVNDTNALNIYDGASWGALSASVAQEDIDDAVNNLLQAGNGISLNYDDPNNELTISSEVTEITAYNGTGATLSAGTVVYQSGVQGTNISVAAAYNSSASTMPAVGIVINDITDTSTGLIAVAGLVRNVDTSSFTAGDVLYVGLAGALTAYKPTAETNLIQNFGRALKINASSGEVLVSGAGRSNDTPNLNDGNVFIGNASNQAGARALVEADISDFGTYLTSLAINGISDVTITTPADNEVLAYDSTSSEFINQTATEAGLATSAQGALADSALQNVVEDTTPQLGGNLEVNGNEIRAGSGNLDMYVLDDFTLDWSGTVDPLIYATSASGKIAIRTGTFSSAQITLGGSTEVGGAFTFTNSIEEQQYSLTGTAIDPSNGTIQYKTLSTATTFTESLADGEYVTLMIDDGSAYTITWPTITWVGGSAPTLETTGYNIIELWHVNGTLYGAFVGAA